ncbi:MAG: glycosyltransferase family 2 protein [Kiritimatiellia bacterium]
MARVSVIIPCRNEREHIAKALDSILTQANDPYELEILVADGMSEDGTRKILDDYAARDPRVRVLENPGRDTAKALEILLTRARGDFFVRFDAHAVCPPGYLATLLEYLERREADNVGGVLQTVAANDTAQASAIAICMNSPFGVGTSFRTIRGKVPLEVETVPFGAWRRECFVKYGNFDPRFARAQDLEHNIRIRRMGGRIICLPWVIIPYAGRAAFRQLAGMAFQYGYWKIPVVHTHSISFSPRQYMPPLLLLTLAVSFLLAPWIWGTLLVPLAYLVLVGIFSLVESARARKLFLAPLCFLGFVIMHLLYGAGYVRGLWDVFVRTKWQFAEPTR